MSHEHGGKGTGSIVDTDKVVLKLLKRNDFFLDIGCGPGDYLIPASKISKNIFGIDTHVESVDKLKKISLNVTLSDATKKLSFENNFFDSILIANVFHGFKEDGNDKKVIDEVKRILKKNGVLGIVEFKKDSERGPPKEIKLSEKELEIIMKKYGFFKVNYINVGEFNYLLILKQNN